MPSVLMLIDVQRNMLEPPMPVPDAAGVSASIKSMLERARDAGASVVHVRNNGTDDDPDAPGTEGWELVHDVVDGEHVVDKHEPDAFAGTGLENLIPAGADVVVAGMQSEYCVRETSLAAVQRGHRVTLVGDAHATYDDGRPAAEISREVEDELRAAGVQVVPGVAVTFA